VGKRYRSAGGVLCDFRSGENNVLLSISDIARYSIVSFFAHYKFTVRGNISEIFEFLEIIPWHFSHKGYSPI